MNLGGLPDFNKMLGETPSPGDPSDIEKLKKEKILNLMERK